MIGCCFLPAVHVLLCTIAIVSVVFHCIPPVLLEQTSTRDIIFSQRNYIKRRTTKSFRGFTTRRNICTYSSFTQTLCPGPYGQSSARFHLFILAGSLHTCEIRLTAVLVFVFFLGPVPEVFLDFSSRERAAKRRMRVATGSGEKEKPLVTLIGLESHCQLSNSSNL